MVVVVSTYPDRESAARVADGLVGEGVAACVNMAEVTSVYSWKGKTENARECVAVFKTSPGKGRLLKERISKTHPYEVPEILEVGVADVNAAYAGWVDGCSSSSSAAGGGGGDAAGGARPR